ncbi:MAG: tRNA1(Val) (adenine(37)-N6)-methyltransferase [Paludibacteraceae bacterium]|nr:tRNA1(Val) (adenine(37)-N6)-methyltransferase [Paludibacteraceae bacterium]
MSNSYFQFKQFRIEQDRCAMKVGTDGVLLGAWANVSQARTILDVGAGTGLISLMLAQRSAADTQIQAIEIDTDANEQANSNFENSPWKERLSSLNVSLQDFLKKTHSSFDLIVSNPPYFIDSKKNPNEQRTLARHTDSLSYEELLSASTILSDKGHFAVILPHSENETFIALAKKEGFYLAHQTHVIPRIDAQPKRILLDFSKQEAETIEDELLIEIERHVYSPAFCEMTKDFYLDK